MFLAFFVGGPIVSAVYGIGISGTGGAGMNAFFAEPVLSGVTGLLGAVGLAGVIGIVSGRFGGVLTGYRCAGLTLVWAAFDGGRIGDLLRHYESPYAGLAVEALVAGGVLVLAGYGIERVGRDDKQETRENSGGVDALLGMMIVVVVGVLICGAVARSEVFGQCLAATIAAGVGGTLIARLRFPNLPLWACIGGVVVLAVVLPLVTIGIEGSGGLRDVYLGRFLAVARPMPLDWLAGGLIGVPLGASWAGSMVIREDPKKKSRVTADAVRSAG